MSTATHAPERELVFERHIPASPHEVYRAWTEPEHMKKWFCPLPWRVTDAEADGRPGGCTRITMRGPEGQEERMRGVYLEVWQDRRIVFTDAYVAAWEPSEKPFMTVTVTFDPEAQGTRYRARVLHWTKEDRQQHEAMGFHEGWGRAADQLIALLSTP